MGNAGSVRKLGLVGLTLALTLLIASPCWADTVSLAGTTSAPLISTTGDPANYTVTRPGAYDSIARLRVNRSGLYSWCSGALVGSGWMLTAAHCITDNSGVIAATAVDAYFYDIGGSGTVYSATNYFVPSGWNGDYTNGADIALVQLATAPPLTPLAIDPTAWVSGDVDLAGYGKSGTGATGATGPIGTLRVAGNSYDDYYGDIPGFPYAYDFDNGLAANDALCLAGSVCDTGRGDYEGMIAYGDSGGPALQSGKVVGVHSFGTRLLNGVGDVDGTLNSSFGELGGDTRVGAYSSWINSTMGVPDNIIPEPATLILLGSGLGLLGLKRRKK